MLTLLLICCIDRHTPVTRVVEHCMPSVLTIKMTKTTMYGKAGSLGCGVAIDARGYIITNHHVIADAEQFVVLVGEKEYTATLTKDDEKADLAVLRIDCTLRPVTLARDVILGETVVAIGHPFGYTHTVTTGILSSLSRDIQTATTRLKVHQVSAALNPGNSGGGVFNVKGELVGISTAIRTDAQGIGFVIGTDAVKKLLP